MENHQNLAVHLAVHPVVHPAAHPVVAAAVVAGKNKKNNLIPHGILKGSN
jgi:hypothetical protein